MDTNQEFLYKHIISKLENLENKIDKVEIRIETRLRNEINDNKKELLEFKKDMHVQIQDLNSFKFKVIGACAFVSFLAVVVFEVLTYVK